MNKWNIIAFSTETSGAIRRTTVDPPVNNEVVPPHPPVGADGNDRPHPDDHGPPPEDDINMPPTVQMTRGNRMIVTLTWMIHT